MYLVLKIMHMLNFLDMFSVGVTINLILLSSIMSLALVCKYKHWIILKCELNNVSTFKNVLSFNQYKQSINTCILCAIQFLVRINLILKVFY
jgi:hypothetical protein